MDEKDFELAAFLEQLERDTAISRAREAAALGHRPDEFDGSCPDCGADIPPERVALCYYECVDCVADAEHRRRTQGY